MANNIKLKATKLRRDIWKSCCACGATCEGCAYRYSCEEQFPTPEHANQIDHVPCDYA